jgi:hypothetical protein
LSEAARERVGRDLYLNEGYIGFRGGASDAISGARVGYQILRWSESPSFGYSIAPVNPVSASRRYQPGNTLRDWYVALPMLTQRSSPRAGRSGFYMFGFAPEVEAAGSFLSGNDYYSPGARYIQLGQGSPLVPDEDASVITPVTPFGSKVPRDADAGLQQRQFGARIRRRGTETRARARRLCHARAQPRAHRQHPRRHAGRITGTTRPITPRAALLPGYVPDVTVLDFRPVRPAHIPG